MSNIINTQNNDSENPVYSRRILNENTSRFSQAPLKLPKYSLNKALKEKDEFRLRAENNLYTSEKSHEKMSLFKKILLAGSAVAAFIILEAKKII